MDIESSEDFEIKFQEEGEERNLSKKESIDLLKSKGIIHLPTKKKETNIKETDDGRIIYSGEDAKIVAESLKKIGNINEDVSFSATLKYKATCFKLSPKVEIFDSNNEHVGFCATILDNEINFNDGIIEFCQSDDKQTEDSILEYFNKLISIFNILNIPFDFVHDYEIIRFIDMKFKNGTHKDVYIVWSQKAQSRGEGYKAIKLKIDDIYDLIIAVNLVWSSIKINEILSTGNVFIFLGYGKYYHFHGDYLLSFANTWMFVEAVINLTWEKMMRNNGFSNKYLKAISKNWSSQTKIDVLQLQGIIDEETCLKAQDMRNRRNKLFHVSKEENKRKINEKISEDCIDLGLSLFYQNLDLTDQGYVVSFDDIASYVNKSIHEPQKM